MVEEAKVDYIDVPENGLFFIPLGGVGEIGMNFYLYACDDKWIAVDCGVGFAGDRFPGIDMLMPDPAFAEKIAPKLKGLIITHAHEDHIGAVASFWPVLRCPVYVSAFAAEMLETRLDEAGLLGRAEVNVFDAGDLLELKPFEIETFAMNHSIPEACSLLIKTPYGTVFHTGDWRFDEAPIVGKPVDMKALKALKDEKIKVLIGDSTNVFVDGDIPSESDVKTALTELFGKYKGKRLIVTCFASNVGRIESIAEAAEQNGRTVCLLGRSLWRVEGAGRAAGYFRGINVFLTEEEAAECEPGSVLYLCTGCQGEPKAALSNISYGTGPVKPVKGDVVVFSSRVIPGNEQAIANIQNRFIVKGIEVVTVKDALVHVSGHCGRKDMEKLYKALKPETAVPVHGEAAHLFEHVDLAKACGVKNAVVLKDGDVLRLDLSVPEVIGEVQTGVLARDKKQLIPLNASILKQRRRMIEDGTVVATVVLDKKGSVVGDIQFSAVGLIETSDPVMEQLKESVKLAIMGISASERKENDQAIFETVKGAVRKVVVETHGRRPLVDVHLVRV
ncbi:MAG: ribonuclease J [Alphaproteobacteria bacterium]|nr:ribonuclease J [Alphaproteobacteria bacterium]